MPVFISGENPYCPVFLDLIEEFADVIEVQLLAHHHTDSFKASWHQTLPKNKHK
jgi:hypothetical protein